RRKVIPKVAPASSAKKVPADLRKGEEMRLPAKDKKTDLKTDFPIAPPMKPGTNPIQCFLTEEKFGEKKATPKGAAYMRAELICAKDFSEGSFATKSSKGCSAPGSLPNISLSAG